MLKPPRMAAAVALVAATLAGRVVQAQARADHLRPWLGAGIGIGSVDVENGSADIGPIAELAAGLSPRTGFGIGARALWWTRPELFGNGDDWRAQTYLGFVSYTPQAAPAFRVTAGVGGTRAQRPTPTVQGSDLAFSETVLETGLEFAVPREHHFAFRAFALRDWRLAASRDAALLGTGLGQWYFGAGIRVR